MKIWTSNWKSALLAPVALLCLGPVACEQDCDSCGGEPAAPRDLAAEVYKSGVHLTWEDASDNEDYFVIERGARSAATLRRVDGPVDVSAASEVQAFGHHYFELVRLPEDTEDYLDTDVDAGLTYFYRVKAVNEAGSATSDEIHVTFR